VATNAALDHVRRRQRRREDALPDEATARAGTSSDEPSLESGITDRLAIEGALKHLSADFRAAVVLRDLAQLEYAEIAEVLQVPIGTVRSRIARGRAQLADLLTGNPDRAARRPSDEP